MSNHNAYPKETRELVEIQVTYSGAWIPVDQLLFAMTTGTDPNAATFAPADVERGAVGILLDGTLPAGRYNIWAKHVKPGSDTQPLIDCGFITLY